jgi:hypothetical protein
MNECVQLDVGVFLPGTQAAAVFVETASKARCVQALMSGVSNSLLRLLQGQGLGLVGYVGRGTTLLSAFSVLDNVRMPLLFQQRVPAVELDRRLRVLCSYSGIDAVFLQRDAGELDALTQIQASFLQAAVHEPELLLLDAVFEGLSQADQEQVAAMLRGYVALYPLRRMLYVGYAMPPLNCYLPSVVLPPEWISSHLEDGGGDE